MSTHAWLCLSHSTQLQRNWRQLKSQCQLTDMPAFEIDLSPSVQVKEVMSELMGKVDGAARGLGGSMHMYKGMHGMRARRKVLGAVL